MNILYLSCHAILEYDETKLFTELGHNVLAMGAYQNPQEPQDIKRPGYKGFYNDHLQAVAIQCSKENLHEELIDWADAIIVMHRPDWILNNWAKMKHKRVIWRTIGQSTPDIENQLIVPRGEGLQVVRYSPQEKNIPGYIGENTIIRFYKDEDEFSGWQGKDNKVITVAQSMAQRGLFCGYEIFNEATHDFNRDVYGPDNDIINGKLLTYDELKQAYRDARAYFYTGTYPASYTLNFIEAYMTGIPIVAIGPKLANIGIWEMNVYEVHNLINNGVSGFVADTIPELKEYTKRLLEDEQLAKSISAEGRKIAVELFGKKAVKKQWEAFL